MVTFFNIQFVCFWACTIYVSKFLSCYRSFW